MYLRHCKSTILHIHICEEKKIKIIKQRHDFADKCLYSQNYTVFPKTIVFPVVMYGCESWTVRKADCQRIDAFELWFWRRLLGVPWTARRSYQSILKESTLNTHWKY